MTPVTLAMSGIAATVKAFMVSVMPITATVKVITASMTGITETQEDTMTSLTTLIHAISNLSLSLLGARARASIAVLALSLFILASNAGAQPGNPGPATFTDMGAIGIGANVYRTATVASGGYLWFKINLTETIDPRRNWLELDMSGSAAATLANPEMAVYDARANLLFNNDDSGGSCGVSRNETAPALSIGGGSGLRLSRTFGPGWNGGRISTGSDSISSLGAGTYWVCVTAWNGAFVNPNPTWTASSTSVLAGTVGLRVTTGLVSTTTWNEAQNSIDAGEFLDTAQVVTGSGPLTNILCSYSVTTRDMFKFHISDGSSFRAMAAVSGFDGGQYQSTLFLFDASGHGVYAIRGTTNNTDTTLSRPVNDPPLAVGDYYLAISSECLGYSTAGTDYGPAVPFTAANQVTWLDWTNLTNNQVLRPNGPGMAGTLSYWGRQADCQDPNGYFANITLTGASYIQSGPASCRADFNGVGGVTVQDIFEFLIAYFTGCP